MNISTLKYFKEIVETKSISKVAKSGHISQSALSQNIQKLETELGYQLLNRSNKGVYPTDMGVIVYKYCGIILRIYTKMENELILSGNKLINVRINGYASFINYSLPCLMYKIKKSFPMYRFELHSRACEESFEELLDEATDLSFIACKKSDDRIEYFPIGKEKIVLVAHKNSRINDTIGLNELFDYEIMLLDNSSPINEKLKIKLKEGGFSIDNLNVIFEIDSIAAIKSAIRNDLGLSFLPYMSIKKELYHEEFKIIKIEDFNIDYIIYLAKKKNNEELKQILPIIDYFIKSGSKEFC
jgi:DNA-binding transcriptional LysR family regulator